MIITLRAYHIFKQLKHLVDGVSEGLKAKDPIISANRIDNVLYKQDKNFNFFLDIEYNPGQFIIKFGKKDVKEMAEILSVIEALGYKPVKITVYIDKIQKDYKWSEFKRIFLINGNITNFTKYILIAEGSPEIMNIGDVAYHSTEKLKVEKILKIGLVPKDKGLFSEYSPRVYLSITLEDAKKYIEQKTNAKRKIILNSGKDIEMMKEEISKIDINFIILQISVPNDIDFYKDPNSEYGYYTYSNIPKDLIQIKEIINLKIDEHTGSFRVDK